MDYFNPYFNPTAFQNLANSQAPAVNQTFQLANNSEFDGKSANSFEEVKKTLTLKTTLFLNADRTKLWMKDCSGAVREFDLNEIIQLDEKDKKINQLEKELSELKEMMKNAEHSNIIPNVTKQESTNGISAQRYDAIRQSASEYNQTNDSKYFIQSNANNTCSS